jgi:citrate synthase
MKPARYMTAQEAAEALNVNVATVYAYVSRGLIRSEQGDTNSRARLYLAEDVQRLLDQKAYRHDPAKVANNTLRWGMPILESALTLITETGLYYRGHNVQQLATTCALEQVAALLWTGEMAGATDIFSTSQPVQANLRALQQLNHDLSLLQKLQVALALAATDDLAAYDFGNAAQTGARVLKLLAAVLAGITETDAPVVAILQQGWQQDNPQSAALLNAALILCADHELNASTFTARVVASTEAHLYLVVTAGLAALQGFKHGGNTLLVEKLLREVSTPEAARRVISEHLRRGEYIPGFGHRLYPYGDPRAALLLRLIAQSFPDTSTMELAKRVAEVVLEVIGKKPNVDFALVVLTQTLGLPPESALAVFALGRTVGWIAHAIEQYQREELLRPRAQYVGPRPLGA